MKTLNDADAVTLTAAKGWHALLFQWSKDIQLWLFITLTLQLFRLVLMGVFHGLASSSSGLATYLTVIADGFRFDISTAAI